MVRTHDAHPSRISLGCHSQATTFWRPFGRFLWPCGGSSPPPRRCAKTVDVHRGLFSSGTDWRYTFGHWPQRILTNELHMKCLLCLEVIWLLNFQLNIVLNTYCARYMFIVFCFFLIFFSIVPDLSLCRLNGQLQVGYGDMAPTSHTGRALGVMCFYIGGSRAGSGCWARGGLRDPALSTIANFWVSTIHCCR